VTNVRAPYLELWPRLHAAAYARRPTGRLPFPLSEPTCRFLAKGRHALWHGTRSVGLGGSGDEILVPAFNCGSEIEALVRAGLVPRYYEATETLEPNQAELEALLSPRTRALLLIHYLGFPQDCARWRTWCNERELLLIEDCAHVWDGVVGGQPVGSYGDIAIYSLSKNLGLPGGLLVSMLPSSVAPPSASMELLSLLKRHAAGVATRCGWTPPEHRKPFPQIQQVEFSPSHPLAFDRPRGSPPATKCLLERLDLTNVSARRRSNYEQLLNAFAERVPPPFRTLSEGASPLVFPLAVANGPLVSDRLRRLGIAARPWWSFLHPSLPTKRFPRAVAWHKRFIVVPVHQGLRPQDVQRVREALRTS
jgi:dTDP-4-amino-4,6-dideoxygalactose transaminase